MSKVSVSNSANSLQPRFLIWLCLILLGGAFLRFQRLGAPSLWLDEIWSVEIAAGRGPAHNQLPADSIQFAQTPLASLQNAPPWWTVWSYRSDYTNPPLYFQFLRFWMNCFGTGELAIRFPSAIFSLVAIAIFLDACRLAMGLRVSLLASIVMAISPGQLEFAREARAYALAILFSVVALNALLRIEEFGPIKSRLFSLGITLLGGMLTHYLFSGVAIALFAYAFLRLRGKPLASVISTFACSAILFAIVWGIPLYHQLNNIPAEPPQFLYENGPDHFAGTLMRFLYLPSALITGRWPIGSMASDGPLLIASALFYLPLLLVPFLARNFLVCLLWYIGTAGLLCLADCLHGTDMLKYLRYSILAGPAVYALVCIRPKFSNSIFNCIPCIAIIVLAAVFSVQQVRNSDRSKEQWRSFSQTISSNTKPGDLLIFTGDSLWLSPGIWYMGLTHYQPESNNPWLILRDPANPDLLRNMQTFRKVWIIGQYPARDGPRLLPGWKYIGYQYREQTVGAMAQMLPPDSADP